MGSYEEQTKKTQTNSEKRTTRKQLNSLVWLPMVTSQLKKDIYFVQSISKYLQRASYEPGIALDPGDMKMKLLASCFQGV